MAKVISELIGAILLHIVIVAFLGLLGFFVWNNGVVGLLHNLSNISYITASAIMLGVYFINLFIKVQVNRMMAVRQQKYMIDQIIQFYKDNAPRG